MMIAHLRVAMTIFAALEHHIIYQGTPEFLSNTLSFTQIAYDGICKENETYYRSFSSQPSACHTVPVNVTFTIQRQPF